MNNTLRYRSTFREIEEWFARELFWDVRLHAFDHRTLECRHSAPMREGRPDFDVGWRGKIEVHHAGVPQEEVKSRLDQLRVHVRGNPGNDRNRTYGEVILWTSDFPNLGREIPWEARRQDIYHFDRLPAKSRANMWYNYANAIHLLHVSGIETAFGVTTDHDKLVARAFGATPYRYGVMGGPSAYADDVSGSLVLSLRNGPPYPKPRPNDWFTRKIIHHVCRDYEEAITIKLSNPHCSNWHILDLHEMAKRLINEGYFSEMSPHVE